MSKSRNSSSSGYNKTIKEVKTRKNRIRKANHRMDELVRRGPRIKRGLELERLIRSLVDSWNRSRSRARWQRRHRRRIVMELNAVAWLESRSACRGPAEMSRVGSVPTQATPNPETKAAPPTCQTAWKRPLPHERIRPLRFIRYLRTRFHDVRSRYTSPPFCIKCESDRRQAIDLRVVTH